jgi:prevent-host-death family protein
MKTTGPRKSATLGPNDATVVGIRELRDHLSSYLERVKAGEPVTISEHGRPIARIIGTHVPARLLELASQGEVTLATRPRTPVSELPRIPVKGSVADLIIELRGD